MIVIHIKSTFVSHYDDIESRRSSRLGFSGIITTRFIHLSLQSDDGFSSKVVCLALLHLGGFGSRKCHAFLTFFKLEFHLVGFKRFASIRGRSGLGMVFHKERIQERRFSSFMTLQESTCSAENNNISKMDPSVSTFNFGNLVL